MTEAAQTFGFRSSLDGLRSVAVGLVLAYHLGLISSGWIGVDLFFVLSGYLITGLLVHEAKASGTVNPGHFWLRRLRRLIPGVLLLVAFVTVLAVFLPRSFREGTRRGDVLGHLGYVTNWVSIGADTSYWSTHQAPSLFKHSWSLAIEEQVYLVWPLLIWVLCRRTSTDAQRRSRIVRLAAGGYLVFAAMQVGRAFTGASLEELYVGTHTRVSAFMLGACCVLFFDGRVSTRIAGWCTGAGLSWLGVAAVTLHGEELVTFRGPLLFAGFSSAMAVTGVANLGPANRWREVLTWLPLRSLGRWSYGIYLYHWPLVVATRSWNDRWTRAAVVTVLSVVLAAVSYELIEHPIRTKQLGRDRWARLAAAAVIIAVLGVVFVPTAARTQDTSYRPALVAPRPIGPTSTAPPVATTVPDTVPGVTAGSVSGTAAPRSVPDGSTEPQVSGVPPTAPAAAVDPVRILMIGDSTAVSIAEQWASTDALSDGVIEVVSGGQIGCPVATTVAIRKHGREQDTGYCPKFRETWPVLLKEFEPDLVLMVTSPSPGWDQKFSADGKYRRLPDARAVAHYDRELAAMLTILEPVGVPLLITEAPDLAASTGEDAKTRDAMRAVNELYRRWDRDHASVAVVPYAGLFEAADTNEGRRQRPDGVHPSDDYMAEIADATLIPSILELYDELT